MYHQRFANTETNFTSIKQMTDIMKTLKTLMEEVRGLDGRYKDVVVLSENVISYLGTVNSKARQEVEINMTSVTNKYKMLISQLEERVELVSEEISNLEGVDRRATELSDRLVRLQRTVGQIVVWQQDHSDTEVKLQSLRDELEETCTAARELHTQARKQLTELGQLLPQDTQQKLSSTELTAEKLLQQLEDMEGEHKRAKNVRYEFQVDVEEVQFWISRSETRIQDRSLGPHGLKDNLNQIQGEVPAVTEKVDNLVENGKVICEKSDNQQEKELVTSTTTNLTEQLGSLKVLIDDKKNAANDAIDAWARFLAMHATVTQWSQEKEAFLQEPLSFTSLAAAKLRLQDYQAAIKSAKLPSTNLTEMNRELNKITAVGSAGDLFERRETAEKLKAEAEGALVERSALLAELAEEWEQCERKLKETQSWAAKARDSLESAQNKKRPIREQLNLREKMCNDITIQRKRALMALEKLQVHFTEEMAAEGAEDVQELGRVLDQDLAGLAAEMKAQAVVLDTSLGQLDTYQQEIGSLRQQILSVEGELRTVSSPAYTAKDRDKATAQQSACRERIKGFQSKITAFTQRMNLINQRGTPDTDVITS